MDVYIFHIVRICEAFRAELLPDDTPNNVNHREQLHHNTLF